MYFFPRNNPDRFLISSLSLAARRQPEEGRGDPPEVEGRNVSGGGSQSQTNDLGK